MAPAAVHGSGAFDVTFSAVNPVADITPACTPTLPLFSLDHYRVVLDDDAAPTSVTDGKVYDYGSTAGTKYALVHRAERTFYGKVFACDNADCTDVWGDDACESVATNSDVDSDTTDEEVWLFQDVANATDMDHFVADNADGCGAASAFFFPVTGSSDYTDEDKLVVYCSDGSGQIKRMLSTNSGWESDGYNYPHDVASPDSPAWAAAPAVVTQSMTETGACVADECKEFDKVDHPWAVPATDGTDYFVRLFAQNNGANDFKHVVMVDSGDDQGTDFELTVSTPSYTCATTGTECDWPSVADVVIAADSTAGTGYLFSALHGRLAWDQIADEATDDGALDVSTSGDEPFMVVSAKPNTTTCSAYAPGTSDPDVLMAEWDASSQLWEVSKSSSPTCADDWAAADCHDPAVTALPGDEFKMYAVQWEGSTHLIHIFYFDGTDWETETSTPIFKLEDGDVISPECLANPATVARVDDGTPYEGMFVSGSSVGDYDGAECPNGEDMPQLALYFAILTN